MSHPKIKVMSDNASPGPINTNIHRQGHWLKWGQSLMEWEAESIIQWIKVFAQPWGGRNTNLGVQAPTDGVSPFYRGLIQSPSRMGNILKAVITIFTQGCISFGKWWVADAVLSPQNTEPAAAWLWSQCRQRPWAVHCPRVKPQAASLLQNILGASP